MHREITRGRKLCKQLVTLGLVEAIRRGGLKRDCHLTKTGHETAEIMEEAIVRIGRWRARAECSWV